MLFLWFIRGCARGNNEYSCPFFYDTKLWLPFFLCVEPPTHLIPPIHPFTSSPSLFSVQWTQYENEDSDRATGAPVTLTTVRKCGMKRVCPYIQFHLVYEYNINIHQAFSFYFIFHARTFDRKVTIALSTSLRIWLYVGALRASLFSKWPGHHPLFWLTLPNQNENKQLLKRRRPSEEQKKSHRKDERHSGT